MIKSGRFGDVYYNVCEVGDPRMEGFEKETGYKHYTIPLAADKTMHYPEYSERFHSDISFLGTNLPEKRAFFKEVILPMRSIYNVRTYGQDWAATDRILSLIQKGGQYFNIPYLKALQKPKLSLEDERKIYTSSTVSLNVHEEYQKKYGGDCNERTFKIRACGGFEITDDVACIRKYFREGDEIVIADDKVDWTEKIQHYLKYPNERLKIIEAGKQRVLAEHTYHHRVQTISNIHNSIS